MLRPHFVSQLCLVLPAVVSTITSKTTIGLLRLPSVAAGLAANWLAESSRLEKLLLAGGEREVLSAVPAGHFFVLGHLFTPLDTCVELHF